MTPTATIESVRAMIEAFACVRDDFEPLDGVDGCVCGAPATVNAGREEFTRRQGLPAARLLSDAFASALAPASSTP